jgi:RimJ/RimL family protein N-acetyltransferase
MILNACELQGEPITLRQLAAEYFNDYVRMFSPTVQELLHASSVKSELEYLENRLEKVLNGLTLFYCIFNNENNNLIGAVEIRNEIEAAGQLYIWINEQFWGTGYYQEAVRLIAQEYFKRSSRPFFNAHVDISNKRSYKALKKCGFAEHGFYKGPYGKQYDLILRKKSN